MLKYQHSADMNTTPTSRVKFWPSPHTHTHAHTHTHTPTHTHTHTHTHTEYSERYSHASWPEEEQYTHEHRDALFTFKASFSKCIADFKVGWLVITGTQVKKRREGWKKLRSMRSSASAKMEQARLVTSSTH